MTEDQPDKDVLRQFAHEIRNPLNAMLGFSSILKGELGEDVDKETVRDYAERINTATKRLLQICERVLDETVQGHNIVRNESVDFHKFCIEVVNTFESEAQEKGVKLTYAIAEDFPILQADPVLLYEIMSNLISNAVKFTPKGGAVVIKGEVSYKNEAVILIVQDTGKGIPTTIIRSLMKGERVTTSFAHSQRKGWGQGMQTVLEKAQLLGGGLEIESALGGGTVACVRLPMDGPLELQEAARA